MIPKRIIMFWIILLFVFIQTLAAQCLAPLSPPVRTLIDQIVSDGEVLTSGVTKWYKSTGTLNYVNIKGGTFIVDGNLTINNFSMESGEMYVRPGASLNIINGGAGILLNGNSKIFNYGNLELKANLNLQGSTSATRPNCLINALSTSTLFMSNTFLVIDDPYSKFINNGKADFGGILTWTNSAPSSVILNDKSVTAIQSMYNQIQDAYAVPDGTACVSIKTSSSIARRITSSPAMNLALSNTHNCLSCTTSPWGNAKVFTNAPSCAAVIPLPVKFTHFKVQRQNKCHVLSWQLDVNTEQLSLFIERSTDGINFTELSRISSHSAKQFNTTDCSPLKGTNYYRIKIKNEPTGEESYSETVSIKRTSAISESIYPNPFINEFTLSLSAPISGSYRGILRNSVGQQFAITIHKQNNTLRVITTESLKPGIYFFQLSTAINSYNYRLVKQ